MKTELKPTKTKVYQYESGKYIVEIEETEEQFGAWITEKRYGVKTFMFGMMKEAGNLYYFYDLVKRNLPEYKRYFQREKQVFENAWEYEEQTGGATP